MKTKLALFFYIAGILFGAVIFGLIYYTNSVPNFCPSFITYHLTSHINREICRTALPYGEGLGLIIYSFLLPFFTFQLFLSKAEIRQKWLFRLLFIFIFNTICLLLIPWLAVGAPSVKNLSLGYIPEIREFIGVGILLLYVSAFNTVFGIIALFMLNLLSRILSRITTKCTSQAEK